MDDLINTLMGTIRMMLADLLRGSYQGLFTNVNGQVGLISSEVSQTPNVWNATVYSVIETMSDNVITPIGVLIITALMCYELIHAVLEKNGMHDVGSEFIFQWLAKACISVLLLSMTFDMSMAIFDIGSEIAVRASGEFTDSTSVDTDFLNTKIDDYCNGHHDEEFNAGNRDTIDWTQYNHSIGELLGMALEAFVCKLALLAMWIIIEVSLVGRMIEIFLYLSVAPIPFSTLTNREWGNIGTNYVRSLAALAFQAFFIVVCVGIYGVMIGELSVAEADLETATLKLLACAFALIMGIRGSKNLAMSIFNAH